MITYENMKKKKYTVQKTIYKKNLLTINIMVQRVEKVFIHYYTLYTCITKYNNHIVSDIQQLCIMPIRYNYSA